MDRFAYTALSGMRAALARQDVTAHNIANASTLGFRRDLGNTAPRELTGSFGERVMAAERALRPQMDAGQVSTTGRALDVAVQGNAFIAVQAPDGGEGYSRRGDLRIGATGVLETGDGLPVIGASGGPVTLPPAERVEIGADGTISIQPPGGDAAQLLPVDRIKLAAPELDRLSKDRTGLFRLPQGETALQDPSAALATGSLEASNVNAMAAMIDLMDQSRAYELQVKMLGAARELDQSSASLLRLE
jgi:flagellar basal-body rod protein FlgF